MWIFFLFRIFVTSEKKRSKVHIFCGLTSRSPANSGVMCFLIPALRRQVEGSSRFHWMGPFSEVWTPEMTPDDFLVVMWYMVSLLRRPPNGRNGRFPVATWYKVTPAEQGKPTFYALKLNLKPKKKFL